MLSGDATLKTPILSNSKSVNQMFPSTSAAMPSANPEATGNSSIETEGSKVTRPMTFPRVYHKFPSAPLTISERNSRDGGMNSVIVCGALTKTRPIPPAPAFSTNQIFPSAPVVIPAGPLPGVGTGNSSRRTPDALMCPILFSANSVNQMLPSAVTVISSGPNGSFNLNSLIGGAACALEATATNAKPMLTNKFRDFLQDLITEKTPLFGGMRSLLLLACRNRTTSTHKKDKPAATTAWSKID
jgi:hypothetical protein